MGEMKMFKRALASLLAACMTAALLPVPALAAETGLCAHHPAHTQTCGYREAEAGQPCGHTAHDETCYAPDPACGLEEGAEVDGGGPHVHTQDCHVLDCPHARGEHGGDCGYREAVEAAPCGHACALCAQPAPEQGTETVTITAFDALDEAVQYQAVPAGTALDGLPLPTALSASGFAADPDSDPAPEPGPVTVEGVAWKPDAPWDQEAEQGSYTFTPILPEGYALAEGTALPELYVRVGAHVMPLGVYPDDADEDGYHDGDVSVINAMIENNNLNAQKDDPEGWAGSGLLRWDAVPQPGESPARIGELLLAEQGLRDELNLTGLANLVHLNCSNNQLTGLAGLDSLSSLTSLDCPHNQLTRLPDLSSLSLLTNLNCGSNLLGELPSLDSLTSLQYLSCGDNKLTALPDLSALTGLVRLICSGNQLEALPDLSGLTELTELYCFSNRLQNLEGLSSLEKLEKLYCYDNLLTELDLTGLTAMTSLSCFNLPLTSLKLPDGRSLTVESPPGGTVMLTSYDHDMKTLKLKATPDYSGGYAFERWNATNTTPDGESANPVTFQLDGSVTMAPVFVKEQGASDSQSVAAAKALVKAASYFTVGQGWANTPEDVKTSLPRVINDLPGMAATGVTVEAGDITVQEDDSFVAAVAGTPDDLDGAHGSFAFTVILSRGEASDTASSTKGFIYATPYDQANDTDLDGYHDGDVDAVNAMIQAHGLDAQKDDPEGWAQAGLVTWDGGLPKRAGALDLSDKGLTGSLDVSALAGLKTLTCGGNLFTGLKLPGGGQLTLQSAEGGTAAVTGYDHATKSVVLEAAPGRSRVFQSWAAPGASVDGAEENPVTFPLEGDVSVTPVFAHGHLDCGASCPGHGDAPVHTEPRVFVPVDSDEDATYVYLDRDYLTDYADWDYAYFTEDTVLCLNGHTIRFRRMEMAPGTSLTICDCSEGKTGKLILNPRTNQYDSSFGIFFWDSEEAAEYNQYGGEVTVTGNGSLNGVYQNGPGALRLHGGKFTVLNEGKNEKFNMVTGFFSKKGSIIITGGTLSVESLASKDSYGEATAVTGFGPITVTGGTIRATAPAMACGVSSSGGDMHITDGSITATARRPHAVFAGSSGSITGGTMTANGQGGDDTAEAFHLYMGLGGAVFTISGGAFEANGPVTAGLGASYGTLILDRAPVIRSENGAQILIMPKAMGLFDGVLQPGANLSGSYTLNSAFPYDMPGLVLAKGVSPEQAAMFSLPPPTQGRENWRLVYDEAAQTLSMAPFSTVSGTVTDQNGPVSGAAVTLLLGAKEIARATTDAGGAYRLTDVGVGSYNILVRAGDVTTTSMAEVAGSDLNVNITVPANGVSSKLAVGEDTPQINVSGLDKVAGAQEAPGPGQSVTVALAAEAAEDPAASARIRQLVRENRKDDILFLDLSLERQINNGGVQTTERISDTGETVLEIVIPFDFKGKSDLGVYRDHDGRAEALTLVEATDPPRDGVFWINAYTKRIHIYASKFSTYAIAYSEPGVAPPPAGGGGGGSAAAYTVTVNPAEHGSVKADRTRAAFGVAVTLLAEPDEGYALASLTVTDDKGNEAALTDLGGGRFTFRMPGGQVTVKAVFKALGAEHDCLSLAFTDLDAGAWYHEAVDYVLERGIMNGYGDGRFAPYKGLSRAMLAQILYNLEGRPAVSGPCPFTDVAEDAWYADAVIWAAEQGIVSGYSGGVFRPGNGITREQLAVMLHRWAGSPAAAETTLEPFSDRARAGAWAVEALRWAVERGILTGKGGGVLDPKGMATRAQVAVMLARYLQA